MKCFGHFEWKNTRNYSVASSAYNFNIVRISIQLRSASRRMCCPREREISVQPSLLKRYSNRKEYSTRLFGLHHAHRLECVGAAFRATHHSIATVVLFPALWLRQWFTSLSQRSTHKFCWVRGVPCSRKFRQWAEQAFFLAAACNIRYVNDNVLRPCKLCSAAQKPIESAA